MGHTVIRVVVVDDHVLFAEGLSRALGSVPDIQVVATFSSGNQFSAHFAEMAIDVVLLDLEMPDGSGLDVLKLTGGRPKTIVVSMHTGLEDRERAIALGARGVLSKSAPLADVAAAIRSVYRGLSLIQDDLTLRGILNGNAEPQLDPGAESLTNREREVLRMMAGGITATDELANALYISQKTVKNHLASIYDKLAISDRAQAAIEAIRLGLDRE